jgi:hypothetical protein
VDALGQGCALLFGSPQGFALSLLLGTPQGFALSLLLGPELGVCGSLRDPVKLLGLLELLAGFRPREKAAEGRMRDVVVGSEFPDRFSGRATALVPTDSTLVHGRHPGRLPHALALPLRNWAYVRKQVERVTFCGNNDTPIRRTSHKSSPLTGELDWVGTKRFAERERRLRKETALQLTRRRALVVLTSRP